jgi:hypothetical protein
MSMAAAAAAMFNNSPSKNEGRRLLFLLASLDNADAAERALFGSRELLSRINNKHQARQALQEILRGACRLSPTGLASISRSRSAAATKLMRGRRQNAARACRYSTCPAPAKAPDPAR